MRRDCAVRLGLALVPVAESCLGRSLWRLWYAMSLVQRPP